MTSFIRDDFAGPGGWSQGLRLLGLAEDVGVEFEPMAVAAARAAGHSRWKIDVRSPECRGYPWPPMWLYIASPPCQSFSMAGKGAGREHISALIKALHLVAAGWTPEDAIAEVQDDELDERSVLVLEPMLVIRRHGPLNVAMEQVPPVLPIWEAYRDVLASWGYSVWTGMLYSEQFGVPQTRKRAVLIASRERQVAAPTPTHSRFHSRSPERLDDGVLPWVSMAQALNWGMTARPSMTVTGGGAATGGAEPFGNQARQTIKREEADGRWVAQKRMGSGMVERHGERPGRELDEPAFTIRANAGGMEPGGFRWALRGNQKPNGVDYQQRSIENPAQTITGETGSYAFVQRSNYSAPGQPGQTAEERGRAERELEQPSVAITSTGFRWPPPDWAGDRPETTVLGDPRLAAPGHRCMTPDCHPDGAPESMFAKATRVTVEEAGILQSFPADYPWRGNKGEQFQQVGNAVPPRMAAAILATVLGLDAPS